MKSNKIQNIYTILLFISSLLLVQSTNIQAKINGLEEKPLNAENLHSGLDISKDKTSFIEESTQATSEAKTEESEEDKAEESVEDKAEESEEDKAEKSDEEDRYLYPPHVHHSFIEESDEEDHYLYPPH